MTDRGFALRDLARYRNHRPQATRAELVAYLREFCGLGHLGAYCSAGSYTCTPRGVYLGDDWYTRRNLHPDITWEQLADYALGERPPVQLGLPLGRIGEEAS